MKRPEHDRIDKAIKQRRRLNAASAQGAAGVDRPKNGGLCPRKPLIRDARRNDLRATRAFHARQAGVRDEKGRCPR